VTSFWTAGSDTTPLSADAKFDEMALDWSGETLLAAALICESVNGAWQPPPSSEQS